ncbi:MAG: response regulator [Proteobacteria bacterium]|nr:response regulator [Pseudomonadota bacterium]
MTTKLENARKKLKARYIRGLRAKKHALEAARQKIDDSDAVVTIRRLAHQLRGSGASFGLPRITEAAGEVEDADPADLDRALGELIALLDGMCTEVASAGRILVVDDDDDIISLIQDALSTPGRFILCAESVAEAQKLLWAQPFDLVILDLLLPDGDGRDLLVTMKRRTATAEIPVLALSGRYASHIKSECMALGVEQFFEKPLDVAYLATAVAELLERRRADLNEDGHDRLTGLRSQEAFRGVFDQVLAFCRRTGITVSIAILEIDEFQSLERQHGHAAAEDLLVFVSGTIVKCLREEDIIGRWAENSFVVGLLGAREDDALFALGRIRQTLARDPARIAGLPEPLYVSISGGVTELAVGADSDDSLNAALDRSQSLIDRVKASRRSRIVHSGLDEKLAQRRVLVAEHDLIAANTLCRLLDADDLQVTHCTDGSAALEAARQSVYDLIIVDKAISQIDGFSVLREIRSMAEYCSVPIVMVTSTGAEADIERAFALGADDYVAKPFRIRVLRARIRRHLRRRITGGRAHDVSNDASNDVSEDV